MKKAAKESENIARSRIKIKGYTKTVQKNKLVLFKEHLKDIIELNNLRNIIKFSIFKNHNKKYDLNLFYKTVEKMDLESKKWNGTYIFVYVPSWSRYFTTHTKESSTQKLKNEILKNVQLIGIKTIDLTEFFDSTENIEQFFPLGYLGHYNDKGYGKIAEIISKELD